MSNLGAALGWKYDYAPGIRTENGVLTNWPSELGPSPDELAVIAEYDAYLASIAYRDARTNDPEMPSDHDIVMALIEGGQALADIKVTINAVNTRHPKP